MRRFLLCYMVILLLLPCGAFARAEGASILLRSHDLVVAPYGDDTSDGSFFSPFQTLARAQQKLRETPGVDPVTVWLRGGTYVLSEPLRFGAEDRANVTYRAYPGEQARVTATRPVSGWTEERVNGVTVWTTNVSPRPDGAYPNALYHPQSGRLSAARLPAEGYYTISSVRDADANAPKSEIFAQHRAVYVSASQIGDRLATLDRLQDIRIRIFHYWKDEVTTLAGYDAKTKRLALARPTTMTVSRGDRYYLENVREALSTPGQWYLDHETGKLFYVPFFGESMADTTLQIGYMEQMMILHGVSNLHFEGITFAGSDWSIPGNNAEPDFAQAAYDVTASVLVLNASDLSFTACTFTQIGGSALKLGPNVQNMTVTGCLFEDIGANAVTIDGLDCALDDPQVSRNIQITDNHICKYGQSFFNGVGVLLTRARDCVIANNEIHDGFYTAISAGWVWGYTYSVTDNVRIADNLIYDIGQGLLSDMGGIYLLGVQPHTVVTGNVVHDVRATHADNKGYGGWGIYLDEGSSYMTVENNLVYRCGSQGFHQHYGFENVVRNNIFAYNLDGQVAVSDKEEHLSCFLHTNILVGDASRLFADTPMGAMSGANNLFWDPEHPDTAEARLKKADREQGLILADPNFACPETDDFAVLDDSPALVLGFVPWDIRAAGTHTVFALHEPATY